MWARAEEKKLQNLCADSWASISANPVTENTNFVLLPNNLHLKKNKQERKQSIQNSFLSPLQAALMESLLCPIVGCFLSVSTLYISIYRLFKKHKWGHGIYIDQSLAFFPSPIYHGHLPGQYIWIDLIS